MPSIVPELDAAFRELCDRQSDIQEHLPTLSELASRCSSVLELGVRDGVSTTALLHGLARSTRPEQKCLRCCDLQRTDGALRVASLAAMSKVDFLFYEVSSLSNDAPADRGVDLVFVDTVHTYHQLAAELQKYAPLASRYLVLHDVVTFGFVNEPGYDGAEHVCPSGLLPAVFEFLASGRGANWRVTGFSHLSNGLLILER